MVKRYHFILDAFDTRLEALSLDRFLHALVDELGMKLLQGPFHTVRSTPFPGHTAGVITDRGHVMVHLLDQDATFEVCSFLAFDYAQVRDKILRFFNIPITKVSVRDMQSAEPHMIECEEPSCDKRAVRVWGGRKVCQDHYDRYRDSQYHDFDLNY